MLLNSVSDVAFIPPVSTFSCQIGLNELHDASKRCSKPRLTTKASYLHGRKSCRCRRRETVQKDDLRNPSERTAVSLHTLQQQQQQQRLQPHTLCEIKWASGPAPLSAFSPCLLIHRQQSVSSRTLTRPLSRREKEEKSAKSPEREREKV